MSELRLKDDFRNPWFLAVLGLIGTALAGTVWMAMIAGATSPGLVSEDYYEKGQNYFHKSAEEQETNGYRLNLLTPAKMQANAAQAYRLYAIAQDGKPLKQGSAVLFAYRPSDARADFSVPMKLVDIGTFSASVTFPLPGTWDLIAQIDADGKKIDLAQRIFVAE